jgi:hypothetical protein
VSVTNLSPVVNNNSATSLAGAGDPYKSSETKAAKDGQAAIAHAEAMAAIKKAVESALQAIELGKDFASRANAKM